MHRDVVDRIRCVVAKTCEALRCKYGLTHNEAREVSMVFGPRNRVITPLGLAPNQHGWPDLHEDEVPYVKDMLAELEARVVAYATDPNRVKAFALIAELETNLSRLGGGE